MSEQPNFSDDGGGDQDNAPAGESSRDSQEKKNAGLLYAATKYTSIAMGLPGATIGGYFIGYLLDRWLGTSYLKIVFLILGIVSGFVDLIRSLMRDMKTKK